MINEFKYGQNEKFGHLHLVYHFAIPVKVLQKLENNSTRVLQAGSLQLY